MKTLTDNQFKRLLTKTDVTFENEIITCYCDTHYFYLNAQKDYSNDELTIELWHGVKEAKLSETQYLKLSKIIDECYSDNIQHYNEENKHEISFNILLDKFDNSRKDY